MLKEYKSLVYEDEDSDVDDEHVGGMMGRESVNLEDVSDDEVGDTRDSTIPDNALKKGGKMKKSSDIKTVDTKIGGKPTKRKSSGDSTNQVESNLADADTKCHKRRKSDEDEMSDESSLRQSDCEEETSQDKREG